MAKTINPDIEIFKNHESAKRAFNKISTGCLLKTKNGLDYFVDKRNSDDKESAYANWPNLYIIIEEKKVAKSRICEAKLVAIFKRANDLFTLQVTLDGILIETVTTFTINEVSDLFCITVSNLQKIIY